MSIRKLLGVKSYAKKPHARLDGIEIAPASTPRRNGLRYENYMQGREGATGSFLIRRIAFLVAGVAMFFGTLFANDKIYKQGPTYTYGTFNQNDPSAATPVLDTPILAFPGMTLNDVTNFTFRGYVYGSAINVPAYTLGTYPAIHRGANGDVDKIVMQFAIYDNYSSNNRYTKAAILQFLNGQHGVMVQKIASRYVSGSALAAQFFSMGEDGGVTCAYNEYNNSSLVQVSGLQMLPSFVQTSPMLLFAGNDTNPPPTLNDLTNATFTAFMGGMSFWAHADTAEGFNRRMTTDEMGNVTSMTLEFQQLDDVFLKCVVLELSNGANGVYGMSKSARYMRLADGYAIGHHFTNEDETFNGYNMRMASAANDSGYGIFDVKAIVDAHPSSPESDYVMSGEYLVIDLSSGPDSASYPVSFLDAPPSGGWTTEYKTTKLVLRRIQAGTFTMGSPSNEVGRSDDSSTNNEIQHGAPSKAR